jgi:hypothetical protein
MEYAIRAGRNGRNYGLQSFEEVEVGSTRLLLKYMREREKESHRI